jgi:hypothetical protein
MAWREDVLLGVTRIRQLFLGEANGGMGTDIEKNFTTEYLHGIHSIQFDMIHEHPTAEGKIQWNAEDGTLEYGLPGGTVNLQVGQEHVVRCRNQTGVEITDGSIVYVSGESGNKPLISLADADPISAIPEAVVLGMTTEAIGHNDNGYVTLMGLVRGVDTDGIASGTMLWLSETTPGAYRATPPTAPNRKLAIGQVITSGTSGSIYVRVTVVPLMMALSDVLAGTPNDGDILVWVAANSRFELQQP